MNFTADEINYILADKSDPFTAARVATHKRIHLGRDKLGKVEPPPSYSARIGKETVRLENGMALSNGDTSYERTIYKDRQRP